VKKVEDKIFDLITKMYSEFNEFRKEVNFKLDQKADKTDIVRLENQLTDKTSVLFDGYMQISEQLNGHELLLKSINNKVDNLSIRMTSQESKFEVLAGGKKSR